VTLWWTVNYLSLCFWNFDSGFDFFLAHFFLPRLLATFWLKECLYTYFRGCRTWISTRIVEIPQGGRLVVPVDANKRFRRYEAAYIYRNCFSITRIGFVKYISYGKVNNICIFGSHVYSKKTRCTCLTYVCILYKLQSSRQPNPYRPLRCFKQKIAKEW
jgi:hypothetical protein